MLNCIANVSVTQSMYLPSQNVVTEFMAVESYGGLFGESTSHQSYKYSGKELEMMNGLGYYDNNARFLDILTGGFISRDALAGSYPHLSPYANCANNPLSIIDPTGMFVVFLPGTTQKYIDDFNAAVKYLQENNVGDNVNHILISEQVYFVGYGDDNMKGTGKGNSFNPTNNTIKWMNDKAIMTSSIYVFSPAEILNHEAAHAKRISENPSKVYENSAILDQ